MFTALIGWHFEENIKSAWLNAKLSNTLRMIVLSPQSYHMKKVTAEGFERCKFEGNSLYLSKASLDRLQFNDAVWIDIDTNKDWRPKFVACAGHLVRITGIFSATDKGHGDLFAGSICDVENIELVK